MSTPTGNRPFEASWRRAVERDLGTIVVVNFLHEMDPERTLLDVVGPSRVLSQVAPRACLPAVVEKARELMEDDKSDPEGQFRLAAKLHAGEHELEEGLHAGEAPRQPRFKGIIFVVE